MLVLHKCTMYRTASLGRWEILYTSTIWLSKYYHFGMKPSSVTRTGIEGTPGITGFKRVFRHLKYLDVGSWLTTP